MNVEPEIRAERAKILKKHLSEYAKTIKILNDVSLDVEAGYQSLLDDTLERPLPAYVWVPRSGLALPRWRKFVHSRFLDCRKVAPTTLGVNVSMTAWERSIVRPSDAQILIIRYGLNGEEPKDVPQIAAEMGWKAPSTAREHINNGLAALGWSLQRYNLATITHAGNPTK